MENFMKPAHKSLKINVLESDVDALEDKKKTRIYV